jgi:hypothetical protein
MQAGSPELQSDGGEGFRRAEGVRVAEFVLRFSLYGRVTAVF